MNLLQVDLVKEALKVDNTSAQQINALMIAVLIAAVIALYFNNKKQVEAMYKVIEKMTSSIEATNATNQQLSQALRELGSRIERLTDEIHAKIFEMLKERK